MPPAASPDGGGHARDEAGRASTTTQTTSASETQPETQDKRPSSSNRGTLANSGSCEWLSRRSMIHCEAKASSPPSSTASSVPQTLLLFGNSVGASP